ncbi:hypothetical protein BJY52DRAFT_463325 [Lactarius psammicola]|nr:hypothetical protein BJY52DRAFT_463325 [Lactarius psammicola]
MSQIDIELAALLNSLSFEPSFTAGGAPLIVPTTSNVDVQMMSMSMMNDEDRGYHSDTSDAPARSSPAMHPTSPCSLMQSFACRHGLSDAVAGHVSDGELSQLIFAHREAFLSCPSAHAGCSAGFGILASLLEKFARPTDGGGVGMDVVRMLRTEAWLLSGLSA